MTVQPKHAPSVGLPGCRRVGSDIYPITVTWVSDSHKTIKFRHARFTRVDKNGLGGDQEYTFEDNPKAHEIEARLCKDGHYYTEGGMRNGFRVLPSGKYHAYQDPSF